MKVEVAIDIYKTDSVEEIGLNRPKIIIKNCGKYSDFIVMDICGTRYEVVAQEIIDAVQKARNS